jgi:hypothetical protein
MLFGGGGGGEAVPVLTLAASAHLPSAFASYLILFLTSHTLMAFLLADPFCV